MRCAFAAATKALKDLSKESGYSRDIVYLSLISNKMQAENGVLFSAREHRWPWLAPLIAQSWNRA